MRKLGLLGLLVASVALAGDDYLGASFDITTSASSACTPALRPKQNYAIRCTQDAYVRVTDNTTVGPAINKDAIAPANKLIDLPTTNLQVYVCALQVSAAGSCYLYLHRERND